MLAVCRPSVFFVYFRTPRVRAKRLSPFVLYFLVRIVSYEGKYPTQTIRAPIWMVGMGVPEPEYKGTDSHER